MAGRKCLKFDDDYDDDDDDTVRAKTLTSETAMIVSSETASSASWNLRESSINEILRDGDADLVDGDDVAMKVAEVVEEDDGVDDETFDDSSPLRHPNPYPIPHLDSPDSPGTETDPPPLRANDAASTAPVFERGISPSNVRRDRIANLNAANAATATNDAAIAAAKSGYK